MILHAGLIALPRREGWRGVLIEGPSGAGKSDLALRALAAGFRLVADDRVLVWRSGEGVYGRASDTLSGLIEVRGLGIERQGALAFCRIVLRLRLADAGEVERMPAEAREPLLGKDLPVLRLAAFEPATPLKLALAIERLGGTRQQEY